MGNPFALSIVHKVHRVYQVHPSIMPFTFENNARNQGYHKIAGVDEAGRGPLAGPVVAAACVLAPDLFIEGVRDSKQITPKKRETLFEELINHPQIHYGVGIVDSETIDQINILQATIQAMKEAVTQLQPAADFLLVDGLELPNFPCLKIIKGDQRSHSIAAASIIAKVTRDRMMEEFDQRWPQYGFKTHKGYGTAKHRQAIEEYGPCPIHRMTFEPVKSFISAQNVRDNALLDS